jgi:hypothetical protein
MVSRNPGMAERRLNVILAYSRLGLAALRIGFGTAAYLP